MLHVIGLGEKNGDISLRAFSALKTCKNIILKTELAGSSKVITEGGFSFVSLDKIYEQVEDFDDLNSSLAAYVADNIDGETAYLVPYSPENDISVNILARKIPLEIYPACGHGSVAVESFSSDYSLVSAYSLADVDTFNFNTKSPLIIYDIDNKLTASSVKLFLSEVVGDEAKCIYYNGEYTHILLCELDRQKKYSYKSKLVVLPSPLTEKKVFNYYDLIDILKVLRAPNGCPWDKVQTHESIKANLIEESYELVEAIECGDADKMCEESGDVLLQSVFHAAIGAECGEFTFSEMISNLCTKLVFRHSHVFGVDSATSDTAALETWEKNKLIEKKQQTLSDILTAVPKQFPALMRLQKIVKKLAKAGRSFAKVDEAYAKYNDSSGATEFFHLLTALVHKCATEGVDVETETQRLIDKLIEAETV